MEAFIGGLPQSIEGNVTASKPQTLEEATNIAHRLMDPIIKRFFLCKKPIITNESLMIEGTPPTTTTIPIIVTKTTTPMIATTITTPTITSTKITTQITITITTATMITITSKIEDKNLLGLILPKNTMETFLYVQDAPYITQEFALSSVGLATKWFHTRPEKLQR
ncbi:hypothetical protein Tco_0856739 [Tanacetum coccineum]|uniref:Uncharacterized protein n=1 Tax=Tanacetum coccineum TaxID=301880 RepID=A0ABQ5B6X5_9ASTR